MNKLFKIFLPSLFGNKEVQPKLLTEFEQTLSDLVKNHPDQQRTKNSYEYNIHPLVCQVAIEKAKDMAERGYYGHIDPDGIGPNYLLHLAGYDLPDYYEPENEDANYVESAYVGATTPLDAFEAWMNSPLHKAHLLGLTAFHAEQSNIGVGHYYLDGSDWGHYWIFLSVHPE